MVGRIPLKDAILVRVQVSQLCRAAVRALELRQYNAFLTLHRVMELGVEPSTKVSREFPLVRVQDMQQSCDRFK